MRRAIFWLILLALGVAAALYLAKLGGSVEVQVGDAWIGTTFPVAMLLLAGLFLALHLVLSVFSTVRRAPERLRLKRNLARRHEAEQAMTRALVALAAGTGEAARLEMGKARKLVGETAPVLWLTAEAERLAGREAAAGDTYRLLADREDSRFLGVRGLLRQAMEKGDYAAAEALAAEAERLQPGAAWLKQERGQLALKTNDWRAALALASPEAPKAALALAAAIAEPDQGKATDLIKQAFEANQGFAPAAIAYAERLQAGGFPRRAKEVLETAWTTAPNPAVAAAYLADAKDLVARVPAVEALIRRNPDAAESRLLLGETTLAVGLTGRARAALEALLASGAADRRAYGAMAALELAEHGDTTEGRAAEARWLRKAAGAAGTPQWRCGACGKAHATWAPVCDGCGATTRIDWQG
jgi:HemY protein